MNKKNNLYTRKHYCFIPCSCGCCEGLIAYELDGQVYLCFVSSDFYTKQNRFDLLKTSLKLLLGKKILKDVLCYAEDLKRLKKFLLEADYHEEDKIDNDSHLVIDYDNDFGYMLYLISDLKKSDIIRFKSHRAYDIVLSKKERDILVKRINYALCKHEKDKTQ